MLQYLFGIEIALFEYGLILVSIGCFQELGFYKNDPWSKVLQLFDSGDNCLTY